MINSSDAVRLRRLSFAALANTRASQRRIVTATATTVNRQSYSLSSVSLLTTWGINAAAAPELIRNNPPHPPCSKSYLQAPSHPNHWTILCEQARTCTRPLTIQTMISQTTFRLICEAGMFFFVLQAALWKLEPCKSQLAIQFSQPIVCTVFVGFTRLPRWFRLYVFNGLVERKSGEIICYTCFNIQDLVSQHRLVYKYNNV